MFKNSVSRKEFRELKVNIFWRMVGVTKDYNAD
jgi:hypothetical protein